MSPDAPHLMLLIEAVVKSHHGAIGPIKGFIRLITQMSLMLTAEQRYAIAERLRDCADKVERQQEMERVK